MVLTPRPPLHMVERGSSAQTRADAWAWIAASAAMTGPGNEARLYGRLAGRHNPDE